MNVGIIGGGQLARMLALAGLPLGLRFAFLDPSPDAPAAGLGEHLRGPYGDPALLTQLTAWSDVVTYELEHVPEDCLAVMSGHTGVYPDARALAIARDRLREKTLFHDLGLSTPAFAAVDSLDSLRHGVDTIGLPAVLKTRTAGYDGKGQWVLRRREDIEPAWAHLGGAPSILERFVDFEREVSIIAVRRRNGDTAFYPLAENVHRRGILQTSRSRPGDRFEMEARRFAARLLDHLEYVGVLALELFQVGDTLLANEMAPRVHNSGHWTIEGAKTSQFENHLRAILDLPLGDTAPTGPAAMVNFVGTVPEPARVLAVPHAHLHLYNKAPRPLRKLGHATVRAHDERALQSSVDRLLALQDAGAPGST